MVRLPFKHQLEKRATKQEWFELQQAQDAYKSHFEGTKILYPEFSDKPNFLINTGNFANNKCYFIPSNDPFVLGLMNSKIIWSILAKICTTVRGGFAQLHGQFVETLPIPDATDKQKAAIATLAEQCQSVAEERYKLQEAVRRRIPDLSADAATAKLNEKLKSWWELDFTNFRKEVKKAFKVDIALKDRSDWEAYLNDERAKVDALTQRLTALESELNTKVYELFALTPAEIKLLEAELEGKM